MLANYEIYQGIYEISETINGQPSWIKDNRAIWYTEANSWVIGGLQYVGSLTCRMYTYPSSGGLTGKSLSEALIFASTKPKYDDRLFIELQVQYMKIPSSYLGRTCCVEKLFLTFR